MTILKNNTDLSKKAGPFGRFSMKSGFIKHAPYFDGSFGKTVRSG
jgi:hypothetical protein